MPLISLRFVRKSLIKAIRGWNVCTFVWRLRLENPKKSRRTICCLKKTPFRRTLKFKSNQNIICRSAPHSIQSITRCLFTDFPPQTVATKPRLPNTHGKPPERVFKFRRVALSAALDKTSLLKGPWKVFCAKRSGNWYFYLYFPSQWREVSNRNRKFPSSCQLGCQPSSPTSIDSSWKFIEIDIRSPSLPSQPINPWQLAIRTLPEC